MIDPLICKNLFQERKKNIAEVISHVSSRVSLEFAW